MKTQRFFFRSDLMGKNMILLKIDMIQMKQKETYFEVQDNKFEVYINMNYCVI